MKQIFKRSIDLIMQISLQNQCAILITAIVKKETENRKDDKDIVKDEYEKQEFDPFRELFLWALVLGRKELALLFWKAGKDHIGRYT